MSAARLWKLAGTSKDIRFFAAGRSSVLLLRGLALGLATIVGTIAASCWLGGSWQKHGVRFPYISETARDMPQAGIFSAGMTATSMLMMACAALQHGTVQQYLAAAGTGAGQWLHAVSHVTGLASPPFLGLLACYDSRRAPGLHDTCVIIFFTGTIVYMLTTLYLYTYLASDAYRKAVVDQKSAAQLPAVRYSLLMKRAIARAFVVFTTLYLPVGAALCQAAVLPDPARRQLHSLRALCQHLSVLCIMLYYGTFYYDFRGLTLFVVHA